MTTLPAYLAYWGKAHPESEGACDWHPLAYHGLDVAATVEAYLQARQGVRRNLARLLGVSEPAAVQFAALLAALHDFGKFDLLFQAKNPERFAELAPGKPLPAPQPDQPHSRVGLRTVLRMVQDRWFPDDDAEALEALLEPLLNAACGHHGRPEMPGGAVGLARANKAAAAAYLEDLAKLLDVQQFVIPPEATRNEASMLLAGVITLCDWVGSAQVWFPYQAPTRSLADYWSAARTQAARAVLEAQLSEPAPPSRARASFQHLYPGIEKPTPLQTYADTVALPEQAQPLLFILEDATGAGKTEAAMTLALRLRAAGFGEGVLLSLPTQTTTNALFRRVVGQTEKFFADGASHTATLAHGRASLALKKLLADDAFAASISAELSGWASDSRKTALLSDFGVCSIDQLVMSVLPVRHVVMRRLGVHRKVLVVDEAHACEPYLMQLLATALETHAQAGGSAIILSATLPASEKERLAQAFGAGAARYAAAASSASTALLRSPHYPLATMLCAGHLAREQAIDPAKPRSKLWFAPVDAAGVEKLVSGWLKAGKCVAILRNTVKSAQETFKVFNKLFPGQVELVHARFTVQHRVANDERLLTRFGKEAPAAGRRGRLVIATQVAEQSLDVDFDEMVTDIAPLDALLQRAGRRWRHIRDADGNWLPAAGAVDGREPGPIYVVMPPVADNAEFLTQLPQHTAFVYDLPAVLYRTAEFIEKGGQVELPSGVRALMEWVYEASPSVPGYLWAQQDASDNLRHGQRAAARVVQLGAQVAYSCQDLALLTDTLATTRLGDESYSVVLCNDLGRPLFGSDELSSVSVRAANLAVEEDSRGVRRLKLKPSAGGWAAAATNQKGRSVQVQYSLEAGLELLR